MSKNKNKIRVSFLCFFIIFALFSGICAFAADACSTKGIVQYMPDGSCKTKNRTCCDNGYFSEWNQACPVVDKKKECQAKGYCWQNSRCQYVQAFDFLMGKTEVTKSSGQSCMDAFLEKLRSDNWANVPADAQECSYVNISCNNNCATKDVYCYDRPTVVREDSRSCTMNSRYKGCSVYQSY